MAKKQLSAVNRGGRRSPGQAHPPDRFTLCPADPADDLFTEEEWAGVGGRLNLTVRELTVAALLFHGHTRVAMARRLRLSVSAIRMRIDRIFQKLQVRDRVGAVLRLVRVLLAIRSEGAGTEPSGTLQNSAGLSPLVQCIGGEREDRRGTNRAKTSCRSRLTARHS
jgi:DNA-binding CsgD family transcriptional regulator